MDTCPLTDNPTRQKGVVRMTPQEILQRRMDKGEAYKLERKLKSHVRNFERSGLLVALDLRKLQDGEAHLVRGHPNFGSYIEAETGGEISAENAKKLSRAGAVLLLLEQAKRLPDLDRAGDKTKLPIGITGARALAAVLSKRGPDVMLAIYDKALEINKLVSGQAVQTAVQTLIPEKEELPELSPGDSIEVPEAESDEEEGNGDDHEAPEWVHNILDRMYDLERALRLEQKDVAREIASEIAKLASEESEEI